MWIFKSQLIVVWNLSWHCFLVSSLGSSKSKPAGKYLLGLEAAVLFTSEASILFVHWWTCIPFFAAFNKIIEGDICELFLEYWKVKFVFLHDSCFKWGPVELPVITYNFLLFDNYIMAFKLFHKY